MYNLSLRWVITSKLASGTVYNSSRIHGYLTCKKMMNLLNIHEENSSYSSQLKAKGR